MNLTLVVAVVGVVALLAWAWRAQRRKFADEIFAGLIPGLMPASGQADARIPVTSGSEYSGEMSVAFNPPRGVAPGLGGTVVDGRPEPRDVMATIVDLAARGHLKITVVEDADARSGRDWRLQIADPPSADSLDQIERDFLYEVFLEGPDVRLSQLPRQGNPAVPNFRYVLANESYERGYFRHVTGMQPVRIVWIVAGLLLLIGFATSTGGLLAAAALAGVGAAVISARTTQRPVRTAEGTALRIQTLGFKRYLATAEVEQFSYEEAAGIFSKYLPWAIALGVADHWVKVFGDLAARANAEGFDDGFDLVWLSVVGWGMQDAMFTMAMFSAMDGLDGGLADGFGDAGGMFDGTAIDSLGAESGGGGDAGGDWAGVDAGADAGADSGGWGDFGGGDFGGGGD